MTLQSSGPIAISDINVEIGQAPTFSSDLGFLNGQILPGLRPATPTMSGFYGLRYFQNNSAGNCNGTGINNCCSNCASGNCPVVDPSNCNCHCGDQSKNCHVCYNCGAVNCANCDARSWLQTGNCNTACTYNCASYQCYAQACACSKIICTKLHQIGMMPYNIFVADQQYGEWLKKHDRVVYKGYIKWAKIVTSWIDGNGPDFMVWIKDKEKRSLAQKEAATKWAYKIATPWSEHMAYLMGAVKNDNIMGRIIMKIGRPICKIVYHMPKKRIVPDVVSTWTMWSLFFFSYYVSSTYAKVLGKIKTSNMSKLFFRNKVQ